MLAQVELLQAQNELAALQNAAPVAGAPPAVAAPAAPTFALAPATVTNAFIDYSTPAGIKLFKMAGEKLKSDFDLETSNFTSFVDNLHSRSIEQGWDKALLLVTQDGTDYNILKNYGTLTHASMLTHANTYAFQESRLAQNSTNLFNCLEATLTKEALATVNAEQHLFTLKRISVVAANPAGAVPGGADNDEFRCGLLLLWSIINRTTAQTNATISAIINQLTRMNNIMEEHKHDIKQFNTAIRTLLNSYVANRRHEYDQTILINSLFNAYKSTKDKEFSSYIVRKQQDHDDNSKVLLPNGLMEDALKFYQTKVTMNEWEQDSEDVKEIINLSAQLKQCQGRIADLEKRIEGSGKSKEGKGNRYEGLTSDQNRKKRFAEAPGWMKQRPSNPTPASRLEKDGKTYKWCDKHRMWCYHTTLECKLKKKEQANKSDSNNNEGGGSGKEPEDEQGGGPATKKVTFGAQASTGLDGWEEYEY